MHEVRVPLATQSADGVAMAQRLPATDREVMQRLLSEVAELRADIADLRRVCAISSDFYVEDEPIASIQSIRRRPPDFITGQ